jgi:cytochrome c oxidase cbb3-type subunit 3
MNSRLSIGGWSLATALAVLGTWGCEREKRAFEPSMSTVAPVAAVRQSQLQPVGDGIAGAKAVDSAAYPFHEERNAYALAEGKRLYTWFNCAACHGAGGGGAIGPPLMDTQWVYGSAPANIFETITQGRPNGMPAFGARMPEYQVWQMVAYVRSLSGQVRTDTAPSRNDTMQTGEPENRRDRERPSDSSVQVSGK